MNWDAIGAVGEILGAGAVVVTLIFLVAQLKHLAEQTRQNTLAIKFGSYAAHAETLSGIQHNTAMDAGLSDIVFRCQKAQQYGDESIDETQWWRYSIAMRSLFTMHEDLFYQNEQGMIDESYWDHRCQYLAKLIASNQVVGQWWAQEEQAVSYVPGFIESINNTDITIPGEYLDERTH